MDRLPPQNQEAEQSVLGAMLLDKQAISEVIPILDESDFYNQLHGRIFKDIVELSSSNKPADIVTVSAKGHDIEYLTNMAAAVPTTANVKHYAGLVKGKSLRRQYIKAGQDIINMAFEGEYDSIVDFKNDVMQKVDIEIKDHRKNESDIKKIGTRVYSVIQDRFDNKNDSKLLYGFKWLDKKTGGAHNKDLTIIAARPSVGKTAFALQVGINVAERENNVAIFSLEMASDQLVERMVANYARIDSRKLRYPKDMTHNEWEIIGQASQILELPIKIFDDIYKIEEIKATCRQLKNKEKLDLVIVDYLQLCETMKKCSTELEKVTHLTRQFKLMAKELNVPIILLSQLTRANEHDNRRPKLTDLRSSGSIEQDADNVFFLHDETYGKYTEGEEPPSPTPIEIIIAKQRNGDRDIMSEVKFYKKTQRFYDK